MRKSLAKYLLVAIAGITISLLAPAMVSQLQSPEITADIHKIKPSSAPYLYEYEAATFDLHSGEKSNLPTFKITQAKRSLNFTVQVDENPDIVQSKNSKPKSLGLLWPVIKKVRASDDIKVINEDTAPAIEYENVNESLDFTLKPDQEKIEVSWNLLFKQDLPTLQFETEKLIPRQEKDSIIFYTRTFRKAFELKDVKLVDQTGDNQKVELNLTQSNDVFNITFSITSEIQFPANLTVQLVSLFHERMIDAIPTQSDFSSFEKPQFLINISEVDEPLKSALINKDYTNVKFGVIDAAGKGRRVSAELTDSNGQLVLRFTSGGNSIKPGLYDLLVQYKDGPSFIGEEEFSWGVLAINPDQSVYKSGQEANIDMAVLDHLGRIVCDAKIDLSIKNPDGVISNLSTENSTIKTTSGCFQKETDLPDYTTKYQTTTEGDYLITLTAETVNGQFTINDKFTVDNDSPFYVKRTGPTRIFPPKTYEMKIEVEANQDASGIVERVPKDFLIVKKSDFEKNENNISWPANIKAGDTSSLSYQFKTPPKSPAFYLLGPLKIGDWQEPRAWQLAIDDNGYIDPDGDGTVAANQITCGGGGNYDCLDEQTRSPTSPSEAGDYVDFDNNELDFYDMTTLTVESVSQIDVYVYHIERKNNMYTEVSLFDTDEVTQYGSSIDLTQRLSAQWDTASFTSLTLTQGQLNNLNVRLRCYKNGSGGPDDCESYAMYGYVTYSAPAAGPTNDQLLRHGTWFDSGVEQPMTF